MMPVYIICAILIAINLLVGYFEFRIRRNRREERRRRLTKNCTFIYRKGANNLEFTQAIGELLTMKMMTDRAHGIDHREQTMDMLITIMSEVYNDDPLEEEEEE